MIKRTLGLFFLLYLIYSITELPNKPVTGAELIAIAIWWFIATAIYEAGCYIYIAGFKKGRSRVADKFDRGDYRTHRGKPVRDGYRVDTMNPGSPPKDPECD
jgi:hypothetical protein